MYLNCADVLVLASLFEGSPTVIKEALACNIPIVSVDVGDVKEVIDNIQGCYIATKNIYDFQEKIYKVLTELKEVNCRERALEYSNDIISEKTYEIYQKS